MISIVIMVERGSFSMMFVTVAIFLGVHCHPYETVVGGVCERSKITGLS